MRMTLFLIIEILFERVVTAASPGVTSHNSLKAQPHTFDGTVFVNSINAILRAGWCVTAGIRQQWRNAYLIETDKENGNFFKAEFHYLTLSFKNDFPLINPSIWSPILTEPTPSGVPV